MGPPLRRQLLSVMLLPTSVAIVMPALLVSRYGTEVGWGLPGVAAALPVIGGAIAILAGSVSATRRSPFSGAKARERLPPGTQPGSWSSAGPTSGFATR